MGFTKLDSGIINSSIWSEPLATRILWITMLAMCDENGFVSCSVPGLIRAANITPEDFDIGMSSIEGPDKFSRTPDNDGRRAERVDGGWILLNHHKYRQHTDIIREQARLRMRKHREKNKHCDVTVTHCNVTCASHSVSESASKSASESETNKTKTKKTRPLWKDDYNEYKRIHDEQRAIFSTPEWIEGQQKRFESLGINLDIPASLRLAKDYWYSERGWSKKRKEKCITINWKLTYETALSMSFNQVFSMKPKG